MRHDPGCPWMFAMTVSCADLLHSPCGQPNDAHVFPGHPCACSLSGIVAESTGEDISGRARTVSFGQVLPARGVPALALDESGHLTEYLPDGTTHPFTPHRNGTCPDAGGCAMCRFLDMDVTRMRAERQWGGDTVTHAPLCPKALLPQTVILVDAETGDPSLLSPDTVVCRCEGTSDLGGVP